MRKALFLMSGIVYWPLLLIGCIFWGLTAVFMGAGEWIHDVAMPPYKAPDPVPGEVPHA